MVEPKPTQSKGIMNINNKKFVVAIIAAMACGFFSTSATAESEASLIVKGAVLFNKGLGPDRVSCASCHVRELGFGLTPEFVQEKSQKPHPSMELFNARNSNDLTGGPATGPNFSRFRDHNAVIVRRKLPNNVQILAQSPGALVFSSQTDPNGLDAPTGSERWIGVSRQVQKIDDVAVQDGLAHGSQSGNALLLWDGTGSAYKSQAEDAILTHAGVQVSLTTEQGDALAAFMKNQFSSPKTRLIAAGYTLNLPAATNAAEQVGKAAFEKHCMQCHGGPGLNTTAANHVVENAFGMSHGRRFETNFDDIASGDSLNLGLGLPPVDHNPTFTLRFVSKSPLTGEDAPDLGGAMERIIVTSDPGALLIADSFGNAQPCIQSFSNCLINNAPPGVPVPSSIRPQARIPTLWGLGQSIADGKPFMRHGQIANIADVVDHVYIPLFAVTAGGLGDPNIAITPQERDGLLAYLPKLLQPSSVNGTRGGLTTSLNNYRVFPFRLVWLFLTSANLKTLWRRRSTAPLLLCYAKMAISEKHV